MNNNIKNTLRLGVMAVAGATVMLSCSDTWSDHYDAEAAVSYSGTTMQALEENAPGFASVVKAVGFDRELTSDNVYTIWAPASFNTDSVLALAQTDSAAVVDQFIKNHITRATVSQNGTDQSITLMSAKYTTMTAAGMFGTAKITQPNLSCTNGVLHIIDSNINYHYNLFEMVKHLYDENPQETSLYSFLRRWDADSLDEARSVSRGMDENGEKIWVDSVTIRNNTVLKNVNALLYREDSDYIAIIPSAEAYKKRYDIAHSLLNFNPSQADRDSLQNYHANMFAMTDLFYNKNINREALAQDGVTYDSLRSTNYTSRNWPYNLYYTKAPIGGLHPEKQLNDILSKCGTPIDCSNGTAYVVDEYPMDVTEQFFKKIHVYAQSNAMESSSDYTKTVASSTPHHGTLTITHRTPVLDENGLPVLDEEGNVQWERTNVEEHSIVYSDIVPNSNDFYATYKIPSTLSGKYELYVVTCPIWAKDGYDRLVTVTDPETGEETTRLVGPADDDRAYRFELYLWQRNSEGTYTRGSQRLTPPADSDGNYFVTDNTNYIDTLYAGDIDLDNAYYGLETEGVMLQIHSYVPNSQKTKFSAEMLLSGFILKPKYEDATAATEAKRK